MEVNDTAVAAWEKLRGTRWSPPAAASGDPARRRTYVFALEQAEQMFRAAATVGVATRPLQVFYGLSQAGRAIAAAAAALVGDGWELSGHGIRCDPGSLSGPLPDVQLEAAKPGGKASFARLSELLGSPLWAGPQQITLSDLWDCLPDNRLHPLRDPSGSRTTPLYVDYQSLYAEPHPLISVPVAYFPPWVMNSPDPSTALAVYMSRFPARCPGTRFTRSAANQTRPQTSPRTTTGGVSSSSTGRTRQGGLARPVSTWLICSR